jgi:hypothetical protein
MRTTDAAERSKWAMSNAQNSSKSGARSNELPPKELDGGQPLRSGATPPMRRFTEGYGHVHLANGTYTRSASW